MKSTLVLMVVLASFLAMGHTFAEDGGDTRSRDTAQATAQPDRFEWEYKFEPEPGVRVWTRTRNLWNERYPSGEGKTFRVVGRAQVRESCGTVVESITEEGFQVFIPDTDAPKLWLWFRRGDEQWSFMGAMTRVE